MHNSKPTPVLVTGAGSGIGLAIVRPLLQAGRRVYAGARQAGHRQMLQDLGAVALACCRAGLTKTCTRSSTPTSSARTA